MKKYFLKSNGQELKIGQVIELSVPVETSYGKGEAITRVKVTEKTLAKLVEDEFVEVRSNKDALEAALKKVTPSLKALATKANMDISCAYMLCALVSDVSPMAHLTLLIESLACERNKGKLIKNDIVWWLHPGQGYKPTGMSSSNPLVNRGPVFYDQKDANDAYAMIHPFIEEFFNGK